MAEEQITKRGPSVLLLLAGLAALVVSVSALIGRNPLGILGDAQLGWILVLIAVVVGAGLVLGPVLRSTVGRNRS